jgi:hypothetical protein
LAATAWKWPRLWSRDTSTTFFPPTHIENYCMLTSGADPDHSDTDYEGQTFSIKKIWKNFNFFEEQKMLNIYFNVTMNDFQAPGKASSLLNKTYSSLKTLNYFIFLGRLF